MTIDEMKKRKKELGYSNEALARLSGVPYATVQKVFSGQTQSPRHQTLQALEKALEGPPASSKGKGEYTVEDYHALPDDARYELIDGELFLLETPSILHQTILGELYLQFRSCQEAHGPSCRVFLSPCDVQLDMDEKTMLQPDLFILCRQVDWEKKAIWGAPDLTLEILSDPTRSRDMLLKTYKYKNAGVREYWIVDPKRKEVLVYDFSEEDLTPERYSFHDRIPIHLSKGACHIDFDQISQNLPTG